MEVYLVISDVRESIFFTVVMPTFNLHTIDGHSEFKDSLKSLPL